MHHKLTSLFLALPLLCLLILVSLFLAVPEPVEGQAKPAEGYPAPQQAYAEPIESLPPSNNNTTTHSLSLSKSTLHQPSIVPRIPLGDKLRSQDQSRFSGGDNLELVGQIGGASYTVAVGGHYAYVGTGSSLMILDISDLTNPTRVGQVILPHIVLEVAIAGSYAYVIDSETGLRVINIANPSSPSEVGYYPTPYITSGVAIAGSYAYVTNSFDGLRVINIANPSSLTEVGYYPMSDLAFGVAISGSYAYVANGDAGLRVINIANPFSPTEVGLIDTPGSARNVAIAGSYAYVADADLGLRVINIANPSSLTEVGYYQTLGYARDVAITGSYAYVANGSSGLQVINIANPSSPTEVGSIDTPDNAHGVAIAGSYAYVADIGGGLRVINLANPSFPTEVGSYDTPGHANGVVIAGNYAYVANGSSGLRVINIANPSSSTEVGSYDTLGNASGVVVAGNYAYVADGFSGLRVINIANSSSPTEVGSYYIPGYARNVAIAGSYAYVANVSSTLRVINIANPSFPTEVGSIDTPGSVQDVAIAGNYAYVANGSSGLRVINIANPFSPTEIGSIDMPGNAYGVAIAGGYAYVTADDRGLRVINITNPFFPTEVGLIDTPGSAKDVAIEGSYAYIADGFSGLRVINIANPSSPIEVGSYDTPDSATNVAIAGSYAYITDYSGGLVILRFTGEVTPTPTPTNTATNTPTPTNTATASNTTTATPTNTPTNTPTASNTTTATPTASNTPTPTPTSSITAGSTPSASYEPNDTCAQASSIATDGTIQTHTFHAQNDRDWVAFDVKAGVEYAIQARVPSGSSADVILEVYGTCDTVVDSGQDPSFSPDIRFKFKAPTTGTYHLQLLNYDPNDYGDDVRYSVSIRALDRTVNPGALVVVAGRLYSDDERDLQANIQHVTNKVYRLFRAKNYPPARIRYLATDLNIDATRDGISDVSALASKAQLKYAITEWTADKELGPERAFTLYLMDHGGENGIFYLDNPRGERVTAQEIDEWLTQMETSNPGVKVNIIIEACYSGSFTNRLTRSGHSPSRRNELLRVLGTPNRVLITSTDSVALAYASPQGAWFSDSFLDALSQDMSLAEAFEEANYSVLLANPAQLPLLDGNGDGIPNRVEDYKIAAQRGFAVPGSFADDKWPPYIKQAELRNVKNGQAEIWAEVEDDQEVANVWAVVQPPSYQPTSQEGELVGSLLPETLFSQGNNQYGVRSSSFDEQGTYRVIIYAEDTQGLISRPKELVLQTGSQLYLPLVIR